MWLYMGGEALWTGFDGVGTSPDCRILQPIGDMVVGQVGAKPVGGTMVIKAAQESGAIPPRILRGIVV